MFGCRERWFNEFIFASHLEAILEFSKQKRTFLGEHRIQEYIIPRQQFLHTGRVEDRDCTIRPCHQAITRPLSEILMSYKEKYFFTHSGVN